MLQALKEIGALRLSQERKELIDILLQDPDSSGTYKKTWILEFDKDGNFLNVTEEELKKESYHLYLYRQGTGSNAPDFTPTSRVTTPQKTYDRITKWFEKHQEDELLQKIYTQLKEHRFSILQQLNTFNKLSKENKILTIKIDDHYLYEIDLFRQLLLRDFFAKIEEVSHAEGVCSICSEKKEKIFTTSAIYRFYTLDKECYIASGFDKEMAWRNFPICKECFLQIDYGKKYIQEHLRFRFYAREYFLIPQLIFSNEKTLEEIVTILRYGEKHILLDKKSAQDNLLDDEEILQEIVKDADDLISFYLLFLEKSNKAERIALLIEDLLPSRINQIIRKKRAVAEKFGSFNLGDIFSFCDTKRRFFEMVDKIFRRSKVDSSLLFQLFMYRIHSQAHDGKKLKEIALKGVKSLTFLESMQMIQTKGYRMDDRYDALFEQIGAGIDSAAKRGIFLLGVLVQRLLDLQQRTRGSMPFMKNLKGLKMNMEDLKGLVPKTINKLSEYDAYNYCEKRLAEAASSYLLKDSFLKMSIDEINFYFAAGMALSYQTFQTICKGADDEK